MKHIKNREEFLNEYTEYQYLNEDDEYQITVVKQDRNHDYKYLDGVTYELSKSGEDVVAYVSEIEHTEGNQFYDDQVDKYVEYIENGGILESFPVQASPLGEAYNLYDMMEYLSDDIDLLYDVVGKDHPSLYDDTDLYWDIDYGIEEDLLKNVKNKNDLEKYYGKEYKAKYEDEEYIEEDGQYFWKESYYNGLLAVLEYWEENENYALTDHNHRFTALKELGKTMVMVDPS